MRATLNEQRDTTSSADLWLSCLLGLISLSDRVGSELVRQGTARAVVSRRSDWDDELDVLLGVVALRTSFAATLERAAPATPPPAERRVPARHGGLLR